MFTCTFSTLAASQKFIKEKKGEHYSPYTVQYLHMLTSDIPATIYCINDHISVYRSHSFNVGVVKQMTNVHIDTCTCTSNWFTVDIPVHVFAIKQFNLFESRIHICNVICI